jgi:hypothetical protein
MLLALALNHAASSEPRNGNIAEDNAESVLLAGVIGAVRTPREATA